MEGTGDFGNTNTESDFQTLAALQKKMQRTLRTSTTWKWLSTRPSYGIGVRLLGRVDQLLGRAKLSSWKQGSKFDYIKLNQVRLHQAESSLATPTKVQNVRVWSKTIWTTSDHSDATPTTRLHTTPSNYSEAAIDNSAMNQAKWRFNFLHSRYYSHASVAISSSLNGC